MTERAPSHAAVAPPRPAVGGGRLAGAVVVAILLVAGGFGGYALSQHRSVVHVLTGNWYVRDHNATVVVDNWQYGFVQTVPLWIDASGSTHSDSWPDCFRPLGARVQARFGEVPVTAPTGIGVREVVWVDCRG